MAFLANFLVPSSLSTSILQIAFAGRRLLAEGQQIGGHRPNANSKAVKKSESQKLVLKEALPLGTETGKEVLSSLYRTVAVRSLLSVNKTEGAGAFSSGDLGGSGVATTTATHKRKALALSLVSALAGGASVDIDSGGSPLAAAMIRLPVKTIKHVILNPPSSRGSSLTSSLPAA